MLDDPVLRERFCASLDELDQLVKGALDSVKGLDMHEAIESIEPRALLDELARDLALQGGNVRVSGEAAPVAVKPLAFKRCLANLLENAIFYGQRARYGSRIHRTSCR